MSAGDLKYACALARAILVYNVKFEQVQRAGNGVNKAQCEKAWDAIVELARELVKP